MLECIILGDSIAVGTHLAKPECVSYAKSGINTKNWNTKFGHEKIEATTVIISLGTNDHKYIETEQELVFMRNKVKASRVFWILPVGNNKNSNVSIEQIQETVKKVALKNNDVVLPITRTQSDKIHPSTKGYQQIVEQIK